VGFYTVDATHPQTVDDSFCAFVWSLIVQQPTVRVGTIPSGAPTEVYIATQTSAKRKAEAKGEIIVEEQVSTLDVVPDAANKSLDDLKTQYSDGLRIAVDPETSFAAITGSHLRVSFSLLTGPCHNSFICSIAFQAESHGLYGASIHHPGPRTRHQRGRPR
jgi:oxalate---CoA ligase